MTSLGWSPTSGNERQAGREVRTTHFNFQRGLTLRRVNPMDAADLKQGRQGSSREQAVERVTKPCGRKVPGAGRARVNRTSVAACVERKQSPREELAHLCRLASSVQGPEGRRNLRRGARAETKPSTRERSDGKTSRPDSETNDGAEDLGEPGLPDTSRSHCQNPPRKWWSLVSSLNKVASS